MQLEELVEEWLEKALRDIASARFLLGMEPRPLEIIGFHAQQAVEKCMKALLVRENVDPPRSHDLLYLHRLCGEHSDFPIAHIDVCSRLTPYAVQFRYPAQALADESELIVDVRLAEALCDEVVAHIRNRG